jgi:ATP-binding cassette subfamily B protein
MRAWYASTNNGILQTTLNVSMRAGFVLTTLYQWSLGLATVGDVFFAFSMTAIIGAYLRDFGMNLRMLQNHINELEPVAAYMYMQPAIQDIRGAKPLNVKRGAIRFENVTFGYKPDKNPLFQGLSVEIPAGKTVALVGRSGSGKTSFVKLLQRLHDVQYGQIIIDGQNIVEVTQQSLHQSIALVPQDPVLFHRTLAENIAYARPDIPLESIRAAARDAFIDDFIMGLPDGYNTLVGERGIKLSGGERQRVAIARAIVANRPILVMDEATSALDSLSENLVQSALETLLKNRTTLIIAHRLSTIRRADLILVFEEGRVVEQGTHDVLLAQNGAYKKLYDAQAGGFIV